jgi:hypothetical protein
VTEERNRARNEMQKEEQNELYMIFLLLHDAINVDTDMRSFAYTADTSL